MRLAKTVLALAAGLLVAGPALAQPPGGGGGFGGFGGGLGGGLANTISRSKPLQDELKVDADQLEKLTAALTKAGEESRDLRRQLFSQNADERAEAQKKMQEINDKALASALKPEQVKRLKQIENQQAGLRMFSRPEVAEKLKLTDEQKEKITAISRDLDNDRRELFGGGGGGGRRPGAGGGGGGGGAFRLDPELLKKMENLQKEAVASAVKALNDDQKSTYKELTGEPFEMPGGAGALGFGGFGGGGGFGQPGGGGAFGGFGGFGGGQPGTVLSSGVQEQLKLTEEQKKELERIQKEVDAQLDKVLTEEQRKQLKEMRDRQPGRGRAPRQKDD